MIQFIWLGLGIFLFIFSLYNIKGIIHGFIGKKYKFIWKLISIAISILLTVFAFYSYYLTSYFNLNKNVSIFMYAFYGLNILVLFIINRSFNIINEFEEKEEKLINLNFILDNETQSKVNELENKNQQMAIQTEILAEKESELEKINSELVKTEKELENEKKNVERKVIERTKELKKEKDTVENLLIQKTRFINQLSHDLRTPLTPLLNLLPILKDNLKKKEDKTIIDVCFKNTIYLQKLVINTLSLAKLEKNNAKLNLTLKKIYKILEEIIVGYKSNLKNNNLTIKNNVSRDILINIDELRIREVFENIITNAIKYNENKNIEIIINSKSYDKFIEISFKDNGIGLESKDLNNVFEEFYKVDPSRHRHDSSGLGLSITNAIMKMHHGEIKVSSEGLNKGSTFTLKIPLNLSK